MECSWWTDGNSLTYQLQSCCQGTKRTIGQHLDFVGTGIHVFKLFWTSGLRSSRQCLLPSWLFFPHPFVTPSTLLFAELLPMGAAAATFTMAQTLIWGYRFYSTLLILRFYFSFNLYRGHFLLCKPNSSIPTTDLTLILFFHSGYRHLKMPLDIHQIIFLSFS